MSKTQPESSSSSPVSSSPSSPSRSPKSANPIVDLRHVTSASVLSPRSNKPSASAIGSMTSSSIPSSPTSVHSSSSAIFERDIEPLPTSSSSILAHVQHPPAHFSPSHLSPTHLAPIHPPNPHFIPRGHTTESLEQNIPSVLDSAAEILSQMQVSSSAGGIIGDNLIVEAPAAPRSAKSDGQGSRDGRSSGWASPRSAGSFRSRSPSPFGQGHGQGSLLLSIPPGPNQGTSLSPQVGSPSPSRPTISTSAVVLNSPPTSPIELGKSSAMPETPVETPTSAYFSVKSDDELDQDVAFADEDPKTTTRDKAPAYPWSASNSPSPTSPSISFPHPTQHAQTGPSSPMSPSSPSSATSTSRAAASFSNPNTVKRLSFLSYTDLLTSTPTSTLPLSSFTSASNYGAGAGLEPPHITGVGIVTAGMGMGEGAGTSAGVTARQVSSSPRSSFIAIPAGRSHSPPSPSSSPQSQGFAAIMGSSPGKKSSFHAHALNTTFDGSTSTVTAPSSGSKRNSLAASSAKGGNSNRGSIVFLDDLVGGEWEREGLGRGLDERLEGIMT
ncbi:hypothetical protein D9757_007139 [Collybiopsis confluens]|uniref:Uncharacterized protein n=1 Tax=Collybiopsis confluens TaxID=2823264 RepID=A0A8H5HCH0_9AGAR|nr:hypothetical protein D9757_007139 [Collybiopsis confluens]